MKSPRAKKKLDAEISATWRLMRDHDATACRLRDKLARLRAQRDGEELRGLRGLAASLHASLCDKRHAGDGCHEPECHAECKWHEEEIGAKKSLGQDAIWNAAAHREWLYATKRIVNNEFDGKVEDAKRGIAKVIVFLLDLAGNWDGGLRAVRRILGQLSQEYAHEWYEEDPDAS